MRNSIATKIFISFLLVSLLPIAALISYNYWANQYVVYNMKIEDIKKNADRRTGMARDIPTG